MNKPGKKLLAEQLGVSRSSLYYAPKRPARDWALKCRMEEVLREHPGYGHRRLARQLGQLKGLRMQGKFGGAVGNFGAHRAAYPDVPWEAFGARFVRSLGLIPLCHTIQINPHDDLAELSHLMSRINTILLDLSRDLWLYIGRGVFRQQLVAGEVGSSTMPHKVNPIDFENAEGNLGLSTAPLLPLRGKAPREPPAARPQRFHGPTVDRRGIRLSRAGHSIAPEGAGKDRARQDIRPPRTRGASGSPPEVHAEAIQTVLRKHGIEGAYEKLKALTRGEKVTKEKLLAFIAGLPLPAVERKRLEGIVRS